MVIGVVRKLVCVGVLAGLVFAAAGTGTAAAAGTPCWKKVIADWASDGRINGHYSVPCLRATLANMGQDNKIYSDLPDQVTRAMQAHGVAPARYTRRIAGFRPSGPVGHALSALGSDKPSSVPVPLLVLGGLALLLIGAGAAGLVTRRLAARRTPPGPPDT
jgi:hypothetical protein